MANAQVQINKKGNPVFELIPGMDAPDICPYCGGLNMENTDEAVKCLDCGMGKYKAGRRV